MALTRCVPLSTESTTAPPVKFATLGRPVKRPMLTMASRGGTIIHALYYCGKFLYEFQKKSNFMAPSGGSAVYFTSIDIFRDQYNEVTAQPHN